MKVIVNIDKATAADFVKLSSFLRGDRCIETRYYTKTKSLVEIRFYKYYQKFDIFNKPEFL
jgi:hypothetical protein